MSVCGQKTAGSILQQKKPPDCIQVELYLLKVVCLCVNSVDNMLLLPMVISEHVTLDTVPVKKEKIVLSVHSELAVQSPTILRSTIYQSALQAYPHLLLVFQSV